MSLKRSSVIEIVNKFNIRIKCIDSNSQIIDLNKEDNIYDKLKSIIICITPFSIKTNKMTYFDSQDIEQTVKVDMSEDISNLIAPSYRTEDFLFSKDYDSIEEFLEEFKFNMSRKKYSNTVDLEFYIDFASEISFYFDQYFMEFLFKYFTGNIVLYGNSKTSWEMPRGEISLQSLKIERGELRLNSINNFRLNNFDLSFLSIIGNNINYQSPDQLVFYSKDSSSIKYCTIDNCIQIGISGEVESQYKWLNAILDIFSLDINFNTNADKVGKFEHIIKIDNYATVNLTNININKKLTKMIPFKIERCPTLNVLNYKNLFRPKDKGVVEFSISKATDISFTDFVILADGINEKETSAISISNIEDGNEFIFDNINLKNINFLTLSNILALSLDITELTIDTNQSVFNIGSSIFIDDFNINNSNILANKFNLKDLKKIYLEKCYIKSKENLEFSITNMTFNDTELVSLKDINLLSTGFTLNEEIEGKVSIRDSVITATNNLNITTDREQGKSIIDNSSIKAKNLLDKGFLNSFIQNNAELKVSTFNGESTEYRLKNCIFNNKNIHKTEKAYQFKGLVEGSCTIRNNNSNTKFSMLISQNTMEAFIKKDLIISFNDDMTNNNLDFRLDLENICQNITYKSIGDTKANINLYIKDDSTEKYFYTSGNCHYKDSNNLNLYLKNTTVEEMKSVINNDGTMEEDNEKLNFGIKPSV